MLRQTCKSVGVSVKDTLDKIRPPISVILISAEHIIKYKKYDYKKIIFLYFFFNILCILIYIFNFIFMKKFL